MVDSNVIDIRDRLPRREPDRLEDQVMGAMKQDRLEDRVMEAMQKAFEGDVEDPSVVQRAVARMIMDLHNGNGLKDWKHAANAIVLVGNALIEAVEGGLPLEDAAEIARPCIGA